jgi:superfamily II DNA or RNA helicase
MGDWMKELRDDQQTAIDRLDELIAQGKRRIVVQAPTGYGKTIVAASLLKRELELGKRVLFCVPALSLIDQSIEAFQKQGIDDIGVIQAYHEMSNWDMPLQVASIQTLMKRTIPPAQFVILDEVHRWFHFYEKWLLDTEWSDIPIVGLSATPWTKGLGAYFSDLLIAGTTQGMIERGNLSDFKVYAPYSPDLRGVRTVGGDYHESDLSKAMDKPVLIADIVETWQRLGQDRPTLCFGVDRAHAKHIQQAFTAAGVPAGYMDSYTRDDDRRAIKAKFHSGDYKVVCNVGVLTTGVDWDVRALILARPTKSEMLFVQIVGRGLRTAEGKDHLLILDHSDNHTRLGFVTDIIHDKLHDGTKQVAAKAEGILLPKKCPKCSFLKPPKTPVCPACGFKAEARPKIEMLPGDLVELKRHQKEQEQERLKRLLDNRRAVYAMLLTLARMRGKKDGWAYYTYKEIFNDKPAWDWREDPPIPPDPQIINRVRHLNIVRAYATRQHR